jgi:hypothetical protein
LCSIGSNNARCYTLVTTLAERLLIPRHTYHILSNHKRVKTTSNVEEERTERTNLNLFTTVHSAAFTTTPFQCVHGVRSRQCTLLHALKLRSRRWGCETEHTPTPVPRMGMPEVCELFFSRLKGARRVGRRSSCYSSSFGQPDAHSRRFWTQCSDPDRQRHQPA